MVWQNSALTLYHGTVWPFADAIFQQKRPDLTRCRPRSDFSAGFYTTRVWAQAIAFANEKYRYKNRLYRTNSININPERAAVIELSIDRNALGALETLAFVFGDSDWHEFIQYCSSGVCGHRGKGDYYDVVYGPVSITSGKWWQYEQLSFHTQRAINHLTVMRVHPGRPFL
jgi:Protein of unknown function (DUF3990)